MRVVLIDGMPGCGKSTLADNLSGLLDGQGVPSRSYPELLKDLFWLNAPDTLIRDNPNQLLECYHGTKT